MERSDWLTRGCSLLLLVAAAVFTQCSTFVVLVAVGTVHMWSDVT